MIDIINTSPNPAEAWPFLAYPLGGYILIALVLRMVANIAYNGLNSTLFTSTYTHAVRRQYLASISEALHRQLLQ